MAEQNHLQKLDLSSLDVRVKCVLRRLGIGTVEQLLSLTKAELSLLNNCGNKTIARIMKLQKEYSKGPERPSKTAEGSTITNWEYMSRLIVVAIASKEVLEGAAEHGRHYFRVAKQRINTLKRSLEALGEQKK